jgi:hypothetical protein
MARLSDIDSIALVKTIMGVEKIYFERTIYTGGKRTRDEADTIEDFCLNQDGFGLLFCSGERGFNYQEVWVRFEYED